MIQQAAMYRPTIGEGVYTVPDASHILKIEQSKLRRYVSGYWRALRESEKTHVSPILNEGVWGERRERAFNFYALIELYTIFNLRRLGVSPQKIRRAHAELKKRFKTEYPFATQELMSDRKEILVEFTEGQTSTLLELDTNGQMAMKSIIEPFCEKLEFNCRTKLAETYRPLGDNSSVIVSPHHAFGKPTIEGTNITTETIYDLILAGEGKEIIAKLYEIPASNIEDVIRFEENAA